MSNVLITGASGFIGRAVSERLIEKGDRVYALSRHPPAAADNLIPLTGDIIEPNLGIQEDLDNIDIVYHLAGIHTLQPEDPDQSIYNTNVIGTQNVLDFCLKNDVSRLYFTSTAYSWEANPYGRSKIENEKAIAEFSDKYGMEATIFKPSIVMGTPQNVYPGHFSQFITLLIKMKSKLNSTFRIRGNPEGKLNLVPVDDVAEGITEIKGAGTFWLTNPNPPSISTIAKWLSEILTVNIEITPEFQATPIESKFEKLAVSFKPYLDGDNFPSDLKSCHPEIDEQFIRWTVMSTLDRLTGLGEL